MRIKLEEAINIIENCIKKIDKTENVFINEINGRVCSENIYSKIDVPPFDRSPLDGYALKSSDTKDKGVTLKVVEEVCAGCVPKVEIKSGYATRIMTGAPIPKGADCIVAQEKTDYGMETVTINKKLKPFENYCYKGEDVKSGTLLVNKGEELNYIHSGILASAGINKINVYKNINVVLIASGDELQQVGELQEGKIYDSNSFLICGRLKDLGINNIAVKKVSDDVKNIAKVIDENVNSADLIITTGGVSVGKKDFMPYVMDYLGAEKKFHGLDLKPGSPALFSIYKNKPILSLSGNPFASIVTFELLGRIILSKLTHKNSILYVYTTAIMASSWNKKSETHRFIRAIKKDGKVYIPDNHSSGSIFSMKGCNCLIQIEKGNSGILEGEKVTILI